MLIQRRGTTQLVYGLQAAIIHVPDLKADAYQRIIVVGGFGDSEYLRQAFRKSFGSDSKVIITVPDTP
jgi:phosphoribosylformylglycinamidine (FGAM) synthase-like amidotransferase family enzyme